MVAGFRQQVPQEERLAGTPGAGQNHRREAISGGSDLPLQFARQVTHMSFLTS
jgi:hypothetical protein